MDRQRWSWIDGVLIATVVVALFLLPAVRWLVIGPLLAGAVDPFRFADEPLPWLTRLTLSGYATWAAVLLGAIAVPAGLLVRAKVSRLSGRSILALAVVAPLAAGSLDVLGITAAWYADPTDFGPEGVGRCPCPEALRCIGGSCWCGCNMDDEVAVQLVDADGDGRHELRCVYDPPCGAEPCVRPVCGSVTSGR